MKTIHYMLIGLGIIGAVTVVASEKKMKNNETDRTPGQTTKATFGGGCFWCVEAVYERIDGVHSVKSGYAGGQVKNPTYREVCSGTSGHAEVVQVEYDPGKVTYTDLLDIFFQSHDPTQMNRQGADVGTQYRSAIFYEDEEQKEMAETAIRALNEAKAFPKPIVTEVSEASIFYEAEAYHQNYYNQNKRQPYCVFNITPKLKKLGLAD